MKTKNSVIREVSYQVFYMALLADGTECFSDELYEEEVAFLVFSD